MIAAAALLLALAVPTFAQVNPTSPGISYAGCVATRPADLVASVPYSGVDACDIHCRESGYLYAWYIYDTPDGDCSCRLYGPTASEWEPTDNSDLLCADGQYSVCVSHTPSPHSPPPPPAPSHIAFQLTKTGRYHIHQLRRS